MSCFVMNCDALATIAEGLERVLNLGFNVYGMETPEPLREALTAAGCADRYDVFDAAKIYKALYTLNACAYAERYQEGLDDYIPEYPAKVKSLLSRPVWDSGRYIVPAEYYHYIKLLECLIYQCMEGSAMKTQLFKGLRDFEGLLFSYLVHNTAEWKAAPWGEV